ncbi:DinB family protein [Granulicella sp. S190]|uniref:DinB family protein n=1 Tax=Granulicella sp. S190 TaxID=1747226 RepID=UPI0020B12077|nr:DinB family protein [Granulicella sp. S190]
MDLQERQVVLDQLASSEARLLELVDGLTAEQWSFKESPARWSIADNIEHVVVLEGYIRSTIAKTLVEAAEPEKKMQAGAKEAFVFGVANGRSNTLVCPEPVYPTGRWPDRAELVLELQKTRAETVAFATETEASLRDHFFPHTALGDLDCYQWLVVLGQHAMRHAFQIEQVKADTRFPVCSERSAMLYS